MEFILFFLILSLSSIPVFGFTLTEFVYPNFTASNFQFVDSTGSFLVSRNGTFKAAIFNPGPEQVNFYLCVIHAESNTIIWSANGDAPISTSGIMRLTKNGIGITEKDGSFKWSTPPLKLAVYAMQLTETGNLLLLDQFNGTLWQSFDHPTDTIVIGQKLRVGMMLSSAIAGDDLSKGRYRLSLTASDAMLQWQGLTYWKLSMETKAYTNSNYAVEYMSVNQTGLYLFGQGGSVVVIMVNLLQSTFRIAKLDASGQLIVISFVGSDIKRDFVGPVDGCRVPYVCGGLGVCTSDVLSDNPKCSCPANFNLGSHDSSSCVPSDSSYSLPVSCNSTNHSNLSNSSSMSYIGLGFGMDYFTTDFTKPFRDGVNLSICQNLCSVDCSCLGIFYANLSGSCYKLEDEIGSIMLRTSRNDDLLGFVKTLVGVSTTLGNNDNFDQEATDFPLVAIVILPFTGIFLLMALGFILWRRSRPQRMGKIESKKSQPSSPFSEDLDAFSIPGLPVRFEYKQLKAATDNFKTQIGTGGFGAVYKGVLPDNTLVAVKKIINLGIQGQRDFCTEIAIIGNIHHINLVKLKGFCAQERQRLLVYEYMNRGSLDRTLFGHVPVLEWQERVEIALGSARGLAYLHSGCEQKIVHCDVKPENILLHDNFQAKISDFGLSKLLNREESSLFTTMRGTRGYLAPEWLTSSAISDKTDVYSFGMVLLEIVSGRKNCSLRTQSHSLDDSATGDHSSSSSAQGLVYFPLFALEMHEQGRYLELADPKLEGRVSSGDIEKFVRVALCCVHEEPCLRPTMVSVVSMLEGEIPPTVPKMESLNFLRFYGRRFSEASNMEEAGGQIDAMLYPQLAKISFLKNERTFLRKIVEMILALALEGTISKMEILSAYLCKIYWGHGIFGIQSASKLYFGKHVSLLSLGECAMLAAMIPAPELRSPFRDSSRGKTFQARVLKRMVEFGFLDVEMASIAVKQHLRFNSGSPDHPDGSLVISSFSKEHSSTNTKCDGDLFSTIKRVWDWETESKIWEVKEDMDRWATGIKRLESIDDSKFKSKLLFIIRLLLPKVH